MQAFQSWADIIIMAVLVIAYIITFIAQKQTISAKNETIKSLQDTLDAQSSDIKTFKEIVKVSDIQDYVNIKTEVAVDAALKAAIESLYDSISNSLVDEYMDKAKKEYFAGMHNQQINFFARNVTFIASVCYKNKFDTPTIERLINTWFPEDYWLIGYINESVSKAKIQNNQKIGTTP